MKAICALWFEQPIILGLSESLQTISAQKMILQTISCNCLEYTMHPRVMENHVDLLVCQYQHSTLLDQIYLFYILCISDAALLPLAAQHNHRNGVSHISQV